MSILARPLLVVLLLTMTVGRARADATPVQVVLGYLDGVSNWGPKSASGVAEIVRAEGEVRLSVRGLPALTTGRYVFWLVRDGTDTAFQVGVVALQADGTATLDLLLPDAIPNLGWNLALITVEENPNPLHPSARRSIAGRYPRPLPRGTLPVGLPNTGAGGDASLPFKEAPPMLAVVGALLLVSGRAVVSKGRIR